MQIKQQIETRSTRFDNKSAFIKGDHPHAGKVAVCLRAELTNIGWGFVFEARDTNETFFVFKPEHVQWLGK